MLEVFLNILPFLHTYLFIGKRTSAFYCGQLDPSNLSVLGTSFETVSSSEMLGCPCKYLPFSPGEIQLLNKPCHVRKKMLELVLDPLFDHPFHQDVTSSSSLKI